jgi:1,4-alpha-glucan branching enzyme
VYQHTPAFYERDFVGEGFEWIDWNDNDASILSWVRRDASGGYIVCVTNFTPVVRHDYRIGVPDLCGFEEIINTDAANYAGSGMRNETLHADEHGHHGRPYSLCLTVPPLATVLLKPGG